ncbi:serine-tRNA ligase [Kwoniella dejecticola CBS 10117]|uniref:serine--tRNA ligase n=1 Tax=Kwoniella dejecticola CBS 10117 TaxID=1296121 RepID=A0A1A6A8E3_9TREE|nr:serine-tRNA ligase [Kwoniella dejecticola CBS 10117]OBR86323.1 serine-tRNA ligase [Kwoniella dejecticola CBS 10117]
MRRVSVARITGIRQYASQVSLKGPLIGVKPPAPPPASPSSSQSSSGSGRNNALSSSTLPKPRLDYNALLSDPGYTTLNAIQRAAPLKPDHLLHLARLRETQLILLQKLSTIRAKQKEIGSLIRTGIVGDSEELKEQAKKIKKRIKDYEANLVETENELLDLSLLLPNFSHPDAPVGKEENAVILETFGPPIPTGSTQKADKARDHVDFCNFYELLDGEASSNTTGSSWPYLKGILALLEQALIQYSLSIAIKNGFQVVLPPDVVKADIAWRCGFQPRDSSSNPSTQTYHITTNASSNSTPQGGSGSAQTPELCLAGTSEIPLAGLFANRLYHEEDLPKKVVGVGRAFRAEAGARGADTRGLYRVHQFTKVELFAVTTENQSEQMMEDIRAVQKEIAQGLGLSVRVLDMPTEELGASASRKYDMEAWMPGRGKWGEITSTSNCTSYQSRRLSITYRPSPTSSSAFDHTQQRPNSDTDTPPPAPSEGHTGPLPFAHTLNGTAAAIPRLLVALIEGGMRFKGGSDAGEYEGIDLPKVLQRFWIGGDQVGEGRKRGLIRWV